MNNMYKSCVAGGFLLMAPALLSAAEPEAFSLDTSITLSNDTLGVDGGYLVASVSLDNTGETDANIKYWISVKGPQGLIFPAKSVVDANSTAYEVDDVEENSALEFDRGIWIYDYMNNGTYVVSLEGINTDTGERFREVVEFTKGINDGIKAIGDLEITAAVEGVKLIPSEGGYTSFSFNVENKGLTPAEVELWINAGAPNGFDIPVHARIQRTIPAGGGTVDIHRGFWLDATYPDGNYIIKPQLYNRETGERIEYKLEITKGDTL